VRVTPRLRTGRRASRALAGLLALLAGACSAPRYTMEVRGSVQGSVTGPILSARALRSGDRFHFTLRTSAPAHLHVAYCNARHEMEIYPPTGEIGAAPDVDVRVPAGEDEFVLDQETGGETVYLIASGEPLDQADPKLLAAIVEGRAGKRPCAPALDANPTGEETKSAAYEDAVALEPAPPSPPPSATAAPAPSAAPTAAPSSSPARPPREPAPAGGVVRHDARPKPAAGAKPKAALGVVARGVFLRRNTADRAVVVSSDAAGIAVVRISFDHR